MNRWLRSAVLQVLLAAAGVVTAGAKDILVLATGSTATGEFSGLDMDKVHFRTSDGRTLHLARKEVFGVFAEDAAKKLLKPDPAAKGELRLGSSSVDGAILRYDAASPFAIYASKQQTKIALLKPEDKFRFLKLGPPITLNEIDRGSAFGKEALKSIKSLSSSNVLMGLTLAGEYLRLKPSGSEMLEVERLMASLRKVLKEKLKDWFQLGQVSIEYDGRAFLIFHFFSKMDSFTDLKCRIWVQLEDNSLYSASFTYFTVQKANKHHDSVEPYEKNARIKRWRIVLEYADEVASIKESEPAGPAGWWEGDSKTLTFWGTDPDEDLGEGKKTGKGANSAKQQKGSDYYFSRTLGKKVDDRKEMAGRDEEQEKEE